MATLTKGPSLRDYLFEKVGFAPTNEQKTILESPYRYNLIAGGEQAGKSLIASKYLLGRFAETEERGLYWLVAADYERTRAEFEYLLQDFSALGILGPSIGIPALQAHTPPLPHEYLVETLGRPHL